MKLTKITALGLATITTLVTMHSVHAAVVVSEPNYFVRPVLRIGDGEIIDGLDLNGELEASQEQGVVGFSSSTVNLSQGTVKMYSEESSLLEGLQTFGSFGERITITGGAGTNWDLSFATEGMLNILGGGPLGVDPEPGTLFYDVGIAVYKAGQVQWNNFVNNPDFDPVLFAYDQVVDFIDGVEEFNQLDVFLEVFGSVELASDYEVFDIFAFTNVIVNPNVNDGIQEYQADFLNTARFGQTFAAGVEGFSSSGSFLGLSTPPPPPTNNVSSPGIVTLFSLAFAALVMRMRSK